MRLPVAPTTADRTSADPADDPVVMRRVFDRLQLDFARQVASDEATLAGAMVLANAELATLHDANRAVDVYLDDQDAPADLLAEIDAWFAARGSACGRWTPSPRMSDANHTRLREELLARGGVVWRPTIMRLTGGAGGAGGRTTAEDQQAAGTAEQPVWDTTTPLQTITPGTFEQRLAGRPSAGPPWRIVPARSVYALTADIAAASAAEAGVPELAAATLLRLDDPQYEMAVALDDPAHATPPPDRKSPAGDVLLDDQNHSTAASPLAPDGSVYNAITRDLNANRRPAVAIGRAGMLVSGETGWIAQIYVRPTHRGRGVAAALLASLIDSAGRAQLRHVLLGVDSDNAPGLRLYQRAGFKAVFSVESWKAGGERQLRVGK